MSTSGYYRYPSIHGENVVFVSEDDLWSVEAGGGIARRLTANLGAVSFPHHSPDGAAIAFTGREEGNSEVYVMPAEGGAARRLTYLGVNSSAIGWTPDGSRILFSSDSGQPRDRDLRVHAIGLDGGLPEPWPVGPAMSISLASGNRTVIGRNNNDPARWKRYRGGTAGDIWVDASGSGEFRRLIQLKGNVARPMWIGDRIFFLSDHEGVGNLYSCTPDGADLKRHTRRDDFYVRHPNTDGRRIVYHAGADLYLFDPKSGEDRRIAVDYHSPRVQRQRRFVDAAKYLDSVALHPKGHSLAVNARGKSFTFGDWEGAVVQQGGASAPTRYRLSRWLRDGERIVAVIEHEGIDTLAVFHTREGGAIADPVVLPALDIGRPTSLEVSPTHDHVALTNHRNEIVFIDLAAAAARVVDRSEFAQIAGFSWSPDGNWLAYGLSGTQYTTAIKLWERATGETRQITEPVLHDTDPSFDKTGDYLYFIGKRDLNPVYDSLHFDLGFPRGSRPYLITLRADQRSPFVPVPGTPQEETKRPDPPEPTPEEEATGEPVTPTDPEAKSIKIDLDGIAGRVVAFPVPEGIYGQVTGIKGKALYTAFPIEGALPPEAPVTDPAPKGTLEQYDFKEQKRETLMSGVSEFALSMLGKTLMVRAGRRVRVVVAGVRPDDKAGDGPSRKSGWIDLGRLRVSVDPAAEWRQMAHEAWRLQRDHFWTEDMSQIDWPAVWNRYEPLIDRVGTRGEFSDLLWEMQGELGTSHAYEMGGDYRPEPAYSVGHLGADYAFDADASAYVLSRIVRGAPGEPRASSPLLAPGANVREGDRLLAINGRRLNRDLTPQAALVHQAGQEVLLTVQSGEERPRDVTIRALRSEFPARYRDWVEANRRRVHEATAGRVGYVHIPDMGAAGYAEFHRLYLAEVDRDGLIVDVRYNRGGHVSQLLLEKLGRKRVGYDIPRWGKPDPYPSYSVAGPLVALTNQFAGSDGDIFSHVFKLKALGPLIGKRTWGGVIGIWPRHSLADGSVTTQPEFSFWFEDVGWGIENYGTDPDIDVDIAPQDYAHGRDPQMDKALDVICEMLEKNPPARPDFSQRPNLRMGALPD
ncbi:MAG TPA: S41 family peptidase [Chthonomonadaceae bacterium]|nr:S41 family peptidase [Chthonomonadaceae bacterium]